MKLFSPLPFLFKTLERFNFPPWWGCGRCKGRKAPGLRAASYSIPWKRDGDLWLCLNRAQAGGVGSQMRLSKVVKVEQGLWQTHTVCAWKIPGSIFPVFQGIFLANIDEDAAFLTMAIRGKILNRPEYFRSVHLDTFQWKLYSVMHHLCTSINLIQSGKDFWKGGWGRSLQAISFPSEIPLSSLGTPRCCAS